MHFLLDNSSKGFDAEPWWEIYLVAFLTRSVLAACFVAPCCPIMHNIHLAI